MSKAKLLAAKELINEKKYNEARLLLRGVDDPIAKKWLAKIRKEDQTSHQRAMMHLWAFGEIKMCIVQQLHIVPMARA